MSQSKRKTLYALVRISVPRGTHMTSGDLSAVLKGYAHEGVEAEAEENAFRSCQNPRQVTKMRVRGLSPAQVRAMGIALD